MAKIDLPKNCAWWQPSLTPLEAIRATADALEHGTVVPAAAAAIVATGLRKYLAGADLSHSLGLRPHKGQRSELTRERLAARNDRIRAIFERQDGDKTDRARKTAEMLATPPREGAITEADVMAHLIELHREHGGTLPRSWSQVLRLVK